MTGDRSGDRIVKLTTKRKMCAIKLGKSANMQNEKRKIAKKP